MVKEVKKENGFEMTTQNNIPQYYNDAGLGQHGQLGLTFPFLIWARVNVTEESTRAANLTRVNSQPEFV